jgi:hypothetical protein
MRKINLLASAPSELRPDWLPIYTGQLPESWADVQVGHYALLASAGPRDLVAQSEAIAAICQLPPDVLRDDAGHLGAIRAAAPWLWAGPLPEQLRREDVLTHEGTTYRFVGGLHKLSTRQLEGLLDFLQAAGPSPALAAPQLLAVLYLREGAEQTPDEVAAAALAFERLPVAVAWPVLLDFLRSGAKRALHIRNCSALFATTAQLLDQLEAATNTNSFTWWQKPRAWLTRIWIQSAKKTLLASST